MSRLDHQHTLWAVFYPDTDPRAFATGRKARAVARATHGAIVTRSDPRGSTSWVWRRGRWRRVWWMRYALDARDLTDARVIYHNHSGASWRAP